MSPKVANFGIKFYRTLKSCNHVLHGPLCEDSDKIPEGGTTTYILSLSGEHFSTDITVQPFVLIKNKIQNTRKISAEQMHIFARRESVAPVICKAKRKMFFLMFRGKIGNISGQHFAVGPSIKMFLKKCHEIYRKMHKFSGRELHGCVCKTCEDFCKDVKLVIKRKCLSRKNQLFA